MGRDPGLDELAAAGLRPERPLYAGAVIGVDVREAGSGRPERRIGFAGESLRHGPGGLLPPDRRVPVHAGTVFDLASLTKIVVTLTALTELSDLDEPVRRTVSGYDRPATAAITPRQLLTHTAGLPAEVDLAALPRPRRAAHVLATDPVHPPGTRVLYSCVGFLVLQHLLQRRSGRPLDRLVATRIAAPLGLGLTFGPLDHGVPIETIAATELRPTDLTDTRGQVHDEAAAALGGVAGNAGLFGTAADLLGLGRAVLDALAGRTPFPGIPRTVLGAAVSPQLGPEVGQPAYASGLGFRIDDAAFMGGLAGAGRAFGHTGFTGTSLVLDAARDLVVVVLTNRVHPSRSWSDLQPYRRQVHDAVAARWPLG